MPKKDQYDNWQSDSRWACLWSETWDDSIGKRALCNRNLTQEEPLRSLGKEQLPIVEALVKAQPDALLTELCERFAGQTGVDVSVSTMQRAVCRLKLSVKKKRWLPLSLDTPRVKDLRFAYRLWSFTIDPRNLVFIDETGIHLGMTRLYGRAPIGERL